MIIQIIFSLLSFNSIYCADLNPPNYPTINKCPKLENDFKFSSDNFNGRDIRVPPHLTVNRRSYIYSLADRDVKCKTEKYFDLSWESTEKTSENTRIDKGSAYLGDGFYSDGRFRFQLQYYTHEEYCIEKITADHITVKICRSKCDSNSLPCIKKCCDAHQVLNYQHSTSPKYNFTPQCEDSEGREWLPAFYSSTSDRNRIHNDPRHGTRTNFRLTKVNLPCQRPVKISLGDGRRDSHVHDYRLKMLQNGDVYLYQAEDKTWENLSKRGTYCIDGINNVGRYTGEESEQMALLCISDTHFESTRKYAVMSHVYFGVYFFASVFLFLMVLVYLLLFDKQNLHGQTVLSYAITMFLQYIFFGIVHYLNSIRFDEPEDHASWDCFFLAIIIHYLYLSSFCWLTVMNYDLYITFSSVKIMTPSSVSHFYQMYSFFAWGVPSFFIFLFIILDISISKDSRTTLLPTYGSDNCFMSRDALGPFLFYLLAAILIVNLILIVLTFWSFYKLKTSANGTSKALEKFSLWKIFLRLFLVMAVAWVFEILSWINISAESKWYWVSVDILVILQAVAVFVVYCFNERTDSELESKYPGAMKWMKKLCCCRFNSTSDSEASSLFRNRKQTKIVGYM